MNEPTAEDLRWAQDFIENHRNDFHAQWTHDVGSEGYDKSVWLRREAALFKVDSSKPDPEKVHIAVTVAGTTNAGKTTVANLIKNTLQGLGIFCTIEDQEDTIPPLHLTSQVLADKAVVDIKVVQVRRGGMR